MTPTVPPVSPVAATTAGTSDGRNVPGGRSGASSDFAALLDRAAGTPPEPVAPAGRPSGGPERRPGPLAAGRSPAGPDDPGDRPAGPVEDVPAGTGGTTATGAGCDPDEAGPRATGAEALVAGAVAEAVAGAVAVAAGAPAEAAAAPPPVAGAAAAVAGGVLPDGAAAPGAGETVAVPPGPGAGDAALSGAAGPPAGPAGSTLPAAAPPDAVGPVPSGGPGASGGLPGAEPAAAPLPDLATEPPAATASAEPTAAPDPAALLAADADVPAAQSPSPVAPAGVAEPDPAVTAVPPLAAATLGGADALPATAVGPDAGPAAGEQLRTPLGEHVAGVAASLRRDGSGTTRVVLRLDPPELGSVTVSVSLRGGEVRVVLTAADPAAAAALEARRAEVRSSLTSGGLALGSYTVSADAGAGRERPGGGRHPAETEAGWRYRAATDTDPTGSSTHRATSGLWL